MYNFFKQLLAIMVLLTICSCNIRTEQTVKVKPVVFSPHAEMPDCHMNMGSTGAKAWMLGYHLVVMSLDHGSPAHGRLQLKDVVIAADGIEFGPENDPRITLGNAIDRAEGDGQPLQLTVLRGKQKLEVKIPLPQIGTFSSTWPANCSKSDKILDAACRSLVRAQLPDGSITTSGNMGTFLSGLLLLSTGEPRYLDPARRAAYATQDRGPGTSNWQAAYGGILLAEYYLATGDDSVLPGLKVCCDFLAGGGQFPCGSWGHGAPYGGYGALNQIGIICPITLLLAEECGVEIDRPTLDRALTFFSKYAELGAVPYGDMFPYKDDFDKNGRNASCAILMKLAGKDVEANALAESVAMSYWEREEGHTGGFFSFLWGPLAGVMMKQEDFRKFMDYQKWHYTLSRNWKGELIHLPYREALSMQDYNKYIDWGGDFTTGGYGLAYAIPRKKLRIMGAPRSIFAVTSKPSGMLGIARKHYLAREWEKCDAALSKIKLSELKSSDEKYWFKQLKDAQSLLSESTDHVLLEIENNFLENVPHRASKQLEALTRVIGKTSDPRVVTAAKRLAENAYGDNEGRKFYENWKIIQSRGFMSWTPQGPQLKNLLDALPTLHKNLWVPLSPISDIQPQKWKTWLPKEGDEFPEGWYKQNFDDSKWLTADGIQTWFMIPGEEERVKAHLGSRQFKELPFTKLPIAARRIFNVEDTSGIALKLRLQTVRPATTRVYLNGSLIAYANRGKRCGYASIQLDAGALKLLRKGENLLAVSSDYQGKNSNRLDVGLYIKKESFDTKVMAVDRVSEIVLPNPMADATLRIHEPKEKMRKAIVDSLLAKDLPELIKELQSPVGAYRHMVEKTIIGKGLPGLEAVSRLAKSEEWKLRSAYCEIVGWISGRGLAKKGKKKNKTEFTQAEKDAIEKRVAVEIPRLINLLDDKNAWVRRRATWALGRCGDAARVALPKIQTMIEDPDAWVRLAVIPTMRSLNAAPQNLVATAVKGLKQPNTAHYFAAQSRKVFDEYPEIKKDKLEGIVAFLNNLPHGFCGKANNIAFMEMGASLDPSGKVMIPVLVKGIISDPGFGHQRGNARKAGTQVLATYGEKAKSAIPMFKAFLADKENEKNRLRPCAIEALKVLGEDVSEYEKPATRKK